MAASNLKSKEVQIRRARLSDARRLADLCVQLGYSVDAQAVECRLRTNIDNPRRATFVAQDSAGSVVGFIDLDFRCILVADSCAEICGLVVDERVRGCGYGRALIVQSEEWAARSGARQLALRSNVIRKDAHVFYEKLGFVQFKQQFAFRKSLCDGLQAETQ